MENTKIEISLVDETKKAIAIGVFIKTLSYFQGVAEETDKAMNGIKTSRWSIVDLRMDSLHAVAEAVPFKKKDIQKTKGLVSEVRKHVKTLQMEKPEIGGFMNEKVLQYLRKLAGVTTKTLSLKIDREKITTRAIANIDDYLSPNLSSFGTIEGSLDAVYVHQQYRFTIFDFEDRKIECFFEEKMKSLIGDCLGKKVLVRGKITYRKDGKPISVVPQDITALPDADDSFNIGDYVGIWNIPEKSEDYIRKIRDE